MHLILKFTVLEGLYFWVPISGLSQKGIFLSDPNHNPSTFPNLNSPRKAQDAFGGVDVARILKDKQRAGPRFLSGVTSDTHATGRREKHHAL